MYDSSAEGEKPEAGAPDRETELAKRVYEALTALDPDGIVQGQYWLDEETLIDGHFNLRKLARMLLDDGGDQKL